MPNEVLRREHRRQAGNQVSVGNCVISLRLLSALDWNVFFERTSPVEAVLRDDPAGVYPLQDFATRDRYRQAVEEIARGANADEQDVARHAVELARAAGDQGAAAAHVGYYLVDRGQAALKAEFGYRAPWRRWLVDWALRHPRATYFGSIAALLGALMALVAGAGLGGRVASWWLPATLLVLLLPASELAVGLVNHLLTLLLPARSCRSSTSRTASRPTAPRSSSCPACSPGRRARRCCWSGWRSTTWPTPTRSSASPC